LNLLNINKSYTSLNYNQVQTCIESLFIYDLTLNNNNLLNINIKNDCNASKNFTLELKKIRIYNKNIIIINLSKKNRI